MRQPDVDAIGTADVRVTEAELASELRFDTADEFPAVYATSRMIGLMEVAASRVLRPHLEGDELSVGVAVDVLHTAATPPGARVTATARYVGQEGKLFVFEVSASDDAGEIGRGTHKRAVISTARLVAGAAKRVSS
ncbi:MAG TPA: thioesterase [Thermoanaerobaculia bacterium]|jgi:predicted thioesterase|nr:thioesterase [Thermoanaerobaculia bacterium]